ncbi:hypothetical protein ACIREE_01860 [Streptomyces sp. NPDC102467]|uniref:hypothetical protein n=1 Tax=Streptomyces sp. NPDC102467 TaxID=3366179 RepID=UPI00381AD913
MSGREGARRGAAGGVGADLPRVPLSAGAWGAGSTQALKDVPDAPDALDIPGTPDGTDGPDFSYGELADLGGELLRDSSAWKAEAGTEAGTDASAGASADADADAEIDGADENHGVDGTAATGRSERQGHGAESGRPLPGPKPPQDPSPGARGRELASRVPHRRSGVDPVKVLMQRHRDLCERAVDPLEIAAGLEALGVTDRTAARFRHRDVFSLAEEMYARVARGGEQGEPVAATPATPARRTGVRGAWALLALLPGAVCALTLPALDATTGTARLAVGMSGALAAAAALRTTLRHGPLRASDGPPAPATRLWVWWLLAYALLGDGLLNAALTGGPDEPWAPATADLLALAVAVAPALWCAGLYTAGAHRRLAVSRGLAEFAASVRPLLLGAVALFALALAVLLGLSGALLDQSVDYAGAGALGLLLLLARLLAAHGRTHAPAVVLGAAAAVETLAVASVFAARLPGCDVLGTPVEAAVGALGAAVVPGVACGVAALALLVHATRTLTRASAHASADGTTGGAP